MVGMATRSTKKAVHSMIASTFKTMSPLSEVTGRIHCHLQNQHDYQKIF